MVALLLLVPLSIALAWAGASPLVVFVAAVLAIVPLAEWTRRATEQLARRAGAAIGGLLNVTFGNLAELILALFVLAAGDATIVRAMITGSMIGNSLLGLGLAIVAGGWRRDRQRFHREHAALQSSLLMLSVIALLLPALFNRAEFRLPEPVLARLDEHLSVVVSVVLIVVYGINLLYTLVTRRDVFAGDRVEPAPGWSLTTCIAVLVGAAGALAIEAHLVSARLEAAGAALGWTPMFLGLVLLPLVGNASEYLAAVYFARRDRMDLVMTIAVGSTIQVALLTAPVLVLLSFAIGTHLTLVFGDPLELGAIAAVAVIVKAITEDGETTWFEGVLLLAVYVLFAAGFFFLAP